MHCFKLHSLFYVCAALSCIFFAVACGDDGDGESGTPASSNSSNGGTEDAGTDTSDTSEEDASCENANTDCAPGHICVLASANDDAPSCVDPTLGVYDDGSDPAKAFESVGDGWFRKRTSDWKANNLLCNDGSPYAYYIRKGSGDGAAKWLMYFKGGNLCTSMESCAVRWTLQPQFMRQIRSVNPVWFPTRKLNGTAAGLFADVEENPFRNWNMVYFHYCSSDTFVGNALPADNPNGIAIQGAAHVNAVLDELMDGVDTSPLEGSNIPLLSEATEVIVSGGSAGAIGARHQMDQMANRIKSTNPATTVIGFADAAINPPLRPERFRTQAEIDAAASDQPTAFDFWGLERVPDVDCAEVHADQISLCADDLHMIGGRGSAFHFDAEDEGHLAQAGSSETSGADALFVVMSQWDGKVVSGLGVKGLCAVHECTASAECGDGHTCAGGICLKSEPCSPYYCTEEPCWGKADPPGCVGMVVTHANACDSPADCNNGDLCMQGFCVEDIYFTGCANSSDCPEGFTCGGGLCSASAEEEGDCTLPGYAFEEDTKTCDQILGCGEHAACGEGYVCVPRTSTPLGQSIGWSLRESLQGLAPRVGVFLANSTTHTMISGTKFYGSPAANQVRNTSVADAFSLWYNKDPTYREFIAPPNRVAFPLWAADISDVGFEGLTLPLGDTGCADGAVQLEFCAADTGCTSPENTYFGVRLGDDGIQLADGPTSDTLKPLSVTLTANPECNLPNMLAFPPRSYLSITYQYDDDVTHIHTLKIALPSNAISVAELPLPLYIGADGSTYTDAELTMVAGSRIE